MNLLNALEALGYGAIWLSTPALADPVVKQALGFAEEDMLLGFVHVGTAPPDRPRPRRPEPAAFLRHWLAA